MDTSKKIRHFREIRGFTQKELSEKAGVSEITIRKYEAGNVPTKLDTLAKIASALDVSLQALGAEGFANGKTQDDTVKKLQAYEDTGLEPAEITELKKEVESKEAYSIELYNRCKDVEDKLKRYEDLQEQGRLIELPYKIGDTVYRIVNLVNGMTIVAEGVICNFYRGTYCDKDQIYFKDNPMYHNIWLDADEFGKTVFLTQQEAEQALKSK